MKAMMAMYTIHSPLHNRYSPLRMGFLVTAQDSKNRSSALGSEAALGGFSVELETRLAPHEGHVGKEASLQMPQVGHGVSVRSTRAAFAIPRKGHDRHNQPTSYQQQKAQQVDAVIYSVFAGFTRNLQQQGGINGL